MKRLDADHQLDRRRNSSGYECGHVAAWSRPRRPWLVWASRATGLFRNLSPSFDKAYGKLTDILQSRLTVVAEKLPIAEDFADWIAKTISSVDVAELMDWLEPKVRKFGNFPVDAVDVLQNISTMRNIPSLAGSTKGRAVRKSTGAPASGCCRNTARWLL